MTMQIVHSAFLLRSLGPQFKSKLLCEELIMNVLDAYCTNILEPVADTLGHVWDEEVDATLVHHSA